MTNRQWQLFLLIVVLSLGKAASAALSLYLVTSGLDSNQLDQNVYYNLFHVSPQSSDKQMMEYKGVNSASHQKVPHENEFINGKYCENTMVLSVVTC